MTSLQLVPPAEIRVPTFIEALQVYLSQGPASKEAQQAFTALLDAPASFNEWLALVTADSDQLQADGVYERAVHAAAMRSQNAKQCLELCLMVRFPRPRAFALDGLASCSDLRQHWAEISEFLPDDIGFLLEREILWKAWWALPNERKPDPATLRVSIWAY